MCALEHIYYCAKCWGIREKNSLSQITSWVCGSLLKTLMNRVTTQKKLHHRRCGLWIPSCPPALGSAVTSFHKNKNRDAWDSTCRSLAIIPERSSQSHMEMYIWWVAKIYTCQKQESEVFSKTMDTPAFTQSSGEVALILSLHPQRQYLPAKPLPDS